MDEKLKLTVNKVLYQKLSQNSDDFLFCRVPRSGGKKYIQFELDSLKPNVSDTGKIVSIDPLKEYTLMDVNRNQIEKIKGMDLYNKYYEYLPFLDGEGKNTDKKTFEEESQIAEENKKIIEKITRQQKKSKEVVKENKQQNQDVENIKALPVNNIIPKEDEGVFSQEQFKEIRKGIRNRVDVSKYSSINLNHLQMKEIRLGLESGIDVNVYNNSKFDAEQMKELRLGLMQGFDMKKYHEFTGEQIREIRLGLERNLDVSKYTNPKFNQEQMKLIRTGLQAGLDVTLFNSERFDVGMMKKIHMDLMVRKIMGRVQDMFHNIKDKIADLIDEAKVSQEKKSMLMSKIEDSVNNEVGETAKFISELMTDAEMVSKEQSEKVNEVIRVDLKEKYEKNSQIQKPLTREEVADMIERAVNEATAKLQEVRETETSKKDGKDKEISKEEVSKKEEAVMLATEIDNFMYDYDTSQYNEVIGNREKQIEDLATDIESGDSDYLKFFLQGIANQDVGKENAQKANELLGKLSEYNPLAKVEELEEANYNMIDGIHNNEKPKKEKEEKKRISIKEKLSEMKEKSEQPSLKKEKVSEVSKKKQEISI